ncbi:MAG: DUF559 domain-containing protein [Chloroflexota bacterium]
MTNEFGNNVLVTILNNLADFNIARDQHWYRIPISSAEKWAKKQWPPHYLAFYQTKAFGQQAHGIYYYARVLAIHKAYRWQLFPEQPMDSRSNRLYYQIILEPLRQLPQPILSRRLRRIVFIPTTWEKFINAVEINDLYNESPLEDRLWAEFKRLEIKAERQEFVQMKVKSKRQDYALDFAIYCASGKIDVETDGDTWHANPEKAALDNLRDNSLETRGWRVLRFNTKQIREEMVEYCVPTILENINELDGVDEGRVLTRKFDLKTQENVRQMSLFDDL